MKRMIAAAAFTAAFVVLLFSPQVVQAATTVIYVDVDAAGEDDGTSWEDAYTDLQDALSQARLLDPDRDNLVQIWVAEGVYVPGNDQDDAFELVNFATIYGGFSGTETSVGDADPTFNLTVLSGDIDRDDSQQPVITDLSSVEDNDNNAYHVVDASDLNEGTLVTGVTITAGNAERSSGDDSRGGGLFNEGGRVLLIDVIFSGNTAENDGGAIYNDDLVRAENVTFMANEARSGGAIRNEGEGVLELDAVIFRDNDANVRTVDGERSGGNGGAISSVEDTTVTINGAEFVRNTANRGGAIHNTSVIEIYDAEFDNNATNTVGGGVSNEDGARIELLAVTFKGNSADDQGGAVFNGGDLAIVNGLFEENAAEDRGGAVATYDDNADIINSMFRLNETEDDESEGGAIYNENGNLLLLNNTFTLNEAKGEDSLGGALYNNGGEPDITNSIMWDNEPNQVSNEDDGDEDPTNDSRPTYLASLIDDSNGSGDDWDTFLGTDGGDNIDSNPDFVAGPLGVVRPSLDSPAVDAGDDSELPDDEYDIDRDGNVAEELPLDLDGKERVLDGDVDMGAYETSDATPDEPESLVVTPTITHAMTTSQMTLDLTWSDMAEDEYYQQVEISNDGDEWRTFDTIAPNVEVYRAEGLVCETEYFFRVLAVGGDDPSDPSNEDSATTGTCIIPDGGFENDDDRDPDHWDLVQGSTVDGIIRRARLAFDGEHFVVLQGDESLGGIQQTLDLSGSEDDEWTLVYHFGGRDVDNSGRIGVQIFLFDEDGERIQGRTCLFTARDSFDFTRRSCSINARNDFAQIQVRVGWLNVESGFLGIDNVTLEQTQ